MDYSARNRLIKKTLVAAFVGRKVSVRGDRGTAYGWVSIKVDWTPLDCDQSNEMRRQVIGLLKTAGVKFSQYWPDDNTNEPRDEVSLSFNQSRYFRTMKHEDGTMSVLDNSYGAEWRAA